MSIPSILWNTIDPRVLKPDTPASYAAVEGAIAKLDCEALKSLIMEGALASAAFWTARGLTAMSIGIWDDFSENRLNEMADELLSFGSQTVLAMLVRPEVMTELIVDTNKLTKPRPVHMASALYKTRCGQHFDFEKACALLPVHVPGYWDLTYKDAVGAYILKKYGQEIAPGLWKKHDMDRRIKQIIFMEDAPQKSWRKRRAAEVTASCQVPVLQRPDSQPVPRSAAASYSPRVADLIVTGWHPLRGVCCVWALSGGVARGLAQPPATGRHPCGMRRRVR